MRNTKRKQVIVLDRLNEICSDVDTADHGYGYACFRRLVGIGHSGLYRVLYKNSDFSIDIFYKIAKETGVSIDWLVGLSDQKYIEGEKEC